MEPEATCWTSACYSLCLSFLISNAGDSNELKYVDVITFVNELLHVLWIKSLCTPKT